jgi:hypothetical protein
MTIVNFHSKNMFLLPTVCMGFRPPARIMLRNMKARNNAEVNAFVAKLNPPNKELVKALRKLVLETSPMEEAVKWGFPALFSKWRRLCYYSIQGSCKPRILSWNRN